MNLKTLIRAPGGRWRSIRIAAVAAIVVAAALVGAPGSASASTRANSLPGIGWLTGTLLYASTPAPMVVPGPPVHCALDGLRQHHHAVGRLRSVRRLAGRTMPRQQQRRCRLHLATPASLAAVGGPPIVPPLLSTTGYRVDGHRHSAFADRRPLIPEFILIIGQIADIVVALALR